MSSAQAFSMKSSRLRRAASCADRSSISGSRRVPLVCIRMASAATSVSMPSSSTHARNARTLSGETFSVTQPPSAHSNTPRVMPGRCGMSPRQVKWLALDVWQTAIDAASCTDTLMCVPAPSGSERRPYRAIITPEAAAKLAILNDWSPPATVGGSYVCPATNISPLEAAAVRSFPLRSFHGPSWPCGVTDTWISPGFNFDSSSYPKPSSAIRPGCWVSRSTSERVASSFSDSRPGSDSISNATDRLLALWYRW